MLWQTLGETASNEAKSMEDEPHRANPQVMRSLPTEYHEEVPRDFIIGCLVEPSIQPVKPGVGMPEVYLLEDVRI